MRLLYTLAMTILMPVIMGRLAFRGIRAPLYRARWKERLGWFPKPDLIDPIWVHAVSVGEFNTAIALVNKLMRRYPDRDMIITTVTPTGSERVKDVYGDEVFHVYLPYDHPSSVKRFLNRTQPSIAVIMETEIWPALFLQCRERGIPIVVPNARLSEKSLNGYQPVRKLAAMALNCATKVMAQTELDARRLLKLGGDPERISVAGSLKYELHIEEDTAQRGKLMRNAWGPDRFVFIAASTHEDDDDPVLEAFVKLRELAPGALLILVPRHPERFNQASEKAHRFGLCVHRRTQHQLPNSDTDCFVVDTMGELLQFYATSDVAFVGGSFAEVGGHNAMEAAAFALPVLFGPHTFNFAELNADLLAVGGAWEVHNAQELGKAITTLYQDAKQRQTMGNAGKLLVDQRQGAGSRVVRAVEEILGRQEED
jgi:3-deoxy-D-manno-octulosonic-acid transferase